MNTLETEFDTLTVCPGCGTQGDAQAMLTVCPRDGRRFVPITEWFQRRDDPLLGCVVGGRYAVVGVIGHGGMGDIYRAVHLGLGRQVAVKLLRGGGLEAGGDARQAILDEKFQAEAQYAALVDGPGTVKLLDAGVDEGRGGQRFMVFELLRGQTLDELLDVHGRLPAARVASLGEQIARALESVHAEGLLHADLKPANIMWLGDAHDTDAAGTPEVKLLDFGLSRLLSAPGRCTATAHGTPYMAGTLAYMAPEQMTAGPCDPRTDVYGLGATLHRLVTGVSVHASTGKHAQVGLRAVLADKRTAGPRALETVPPALAAVLRTALDPDPARRYPTAAAFAEALAPIGRQLAPGFEPSELGAFLCRIFARERLDAEQQLSEFDLDIEADDLTPTGQRHQYTRLVSIGHFGANAPVETVPAGGGAERPAGVGLVASDESLLDAVEEWLAARRAARGESKPPPVPVPGDTVGEPEAWSSSARPGWVDDEAHTLEMDALTGSGTGTGTGEIDRPDTGVYERENETTTRNRNA